MDSQIEEIKNKLNVLDVVGSYVKLTKTGVNYRGICPFHSEKGPSFFVTPSRQMWKCFGCGLGGDIFEFIKKIEGVEFGDALRILANKAGVELKRENPQLVSERKKLYEICELACSFFEKQLDGSDWGKKAKEYLSKRGIKEETIKKWRLGYSPDTWQGLSDFLVGRGYTRDEIVRGGLAVQSDKGNNPYDRFRGRIIFPIFDLNSQVIGFSARIFKEADKKETAKYINTPQTLLYDKSNVLYGINFAKLAIRKQNCCVLTEGNTDAIMCHQAGFENTVAVSGTALTPRHLNVLKRYSDNLLFAFDMDLAGNNAINRGIDMAMSEGFNIKVIHRYLNAKDPAEIILENSGDWEEAIKNATEFMSFCFDFAVSHFDKLTPQGRKDIENFVFPKINLIKTSVERDKQLQLLNENLGVEVGTSLKDFQMWERGQQNNTINKNLKYDIRNPEIKKSFTAESRKKLLEERIIKVISKNPYSFSLIKVTDYSFLCERYRKFLEDFNEVSAPIFNSDEPDTEEKMKTVFADFSSLDKNGDLMNIFLQAEAESENDGPEELELCIKLLKDVKRREELVMMSGLIRDEKDGQKENELKKEFDIKAKELHFEK
jgi:DNA primase